MLVKVNVGYSYKGFFIRRNTLGNWAILSSQSELAYLLTTTTRLQDCIPAINAEKKARPFS